MIVEHHTQRINCNDIKLLTLVGKGAFSQVFKSEFNGNTVAAKVIIKAPQCTENEVKYLSCLKHPNILSFFGIVNAVNFVIVTEFMDCSLDDLLYHQEKCPHSLQIPLTTFIKVTISLEIAKGIEYLQSLHLIHGDLKPDNVLISRDFKIKLSDFGLTRKPSYSTILHGTPNYLPPEAFFYIMNIIVLVIFMLFSMVIWQIFTQRLLFVKHNTTEELSCEVINGERPKLTTAIPLVYHDMLSNMWSPNVSYRPSIQECIHTLSLGYLEEIEVAEAQYYWHVMCGGFDVFPVVQSTKLQSFGNFESLLRETQPLTVQMYNFIVCCFGKIWEKEIQVKLEAFLQRNQVIFEWESNKCILIKNDRIHEISIDLIEEQKLDVFCDGLSYIVTSLFDI
ncbi:Protein kinase [Entamoeba marina]